MNKLEKQAADNRKADQRRKSNRRQLVIAGITVVTCLSIIGFWLWAVGCTWRNELESLFSGLAFVGLICTVFLQREELILQRQELEETQDVLRQSAQAQRESEQALRRQIEAMNNASLVDAYSTILQFYDKANRDTADQRGNANHALDNLKSLIDLLDGVQQRPGSWYKK